MSKPTIENSENPQAFPCPGSDTNWPEFTGMTLRDWFAGKVINGMYASYSISIKESADRVGLSVEDFIANIAYCQADAMLKARQNP